MSETNIETTSYERHESKVDISKSFGIFAPLLYVLSGILTTSLGYMIAKDGVLGFDSPVVVAFFLCLVSFIGLFTYALVKKSYLLLGSKDAGEIAKRDMEFQIQKNEVKKTAGKPGRRPRPGN